jgi:hypothetical protein
MCIEGFPSLASAFSAYVTRHISRIEGLLQRTFLVDMIFLTSNGKSYLSVPEFPLRAPQDTELDAEMVPLSLSETYKTFFGTLKIKGISNMVFFFFLKDA